jgi:hypothetical protein
MHILCEALRKIRTLSGNWFEHLLRFVESLLDIEQYKLPGLAKLEILIYSEPGISVL